MIYALHFLNPQSNEGGEGDFQLEVCLNLMSMDLAIHRVGSLPLNIVAHSGNMLLHPFSHGVRCREEYCTAELHNAVAEREHPCMEFS